MSFVPDSSLVAAVLPSPNHGERREGVAVDMILLHYTGMPSAEAALQRMCTAASEVSAHYTVCEDGKIIQLVPEERRAWHAGSGSWAGETDINSVSIGIEIVNPGHDGGYPDFPSRQIAAVTILCRGIMVRKGIAPERVLAHSDTAPARKQDPGEKFPWRVLARSGVGIWVEPEPIIEHGPFHSLGDSGPAVADLQRQLAGIGYGLAETARYDGETMAVVAAFQRHYRPMRVDGIADPSTLRTVAARLAAAPALAPTAT
ncbi:MAG TPA: N-acetylmuramoyl-L-alanine amidase [Xanthobacteraceae bacterium]|nr:N-acetylmuramoyl-L-alanine amidase [Xanthobacteraceae bacterium]